MTKTADKTRTASCAKHGSPWRSLLVLSSILILAAQVCYAQATNAVDINSAIDDALGNKKYSNFQAAIEGTDILKGYDAAQLFILAPSNEYWYKNPNVDYYDYLVSKDRSALNTIVGCQVIADPNFSSAIEKINTARSGEYFTKTIGGCSIYARWQGSEIYLTQYRHGVEASFEVKVVSHPAADFPGLATINGIFATPDDISKNADTANLSASRIFAGPHNFPPKNFAAYGLVAFNSTASAENEARYTMFCRAYVNSVPTSRQLLTQVSVPLSRQMATVWPITTDQQAQALNKVPNETACDDAVKNYNLLTSQTAIAAANTAGANLNSNGPFLLAWSPPADMGRDAAIVLVYDLSPITTYDQALDAMRTWTDAIEGDEELWRTGFSVEGLRKQIQYIVDHAGSMFYTAGG